MIIDWETKELLVEAFKELEPSIKWTKSTRKLGNTEETWFRGDYEDADRIVLAIIRPTKRMQISESYKNRLSNGVAPKKGQESSKASPFTEFGCTTTVLVDMTFINEISSKATPFVKKKQQKLEWS